jgi:hypothetical protein
MAGIIKKYDNSAFAEECGIRGKIGVTRTNESGDVTWQEAVHNDIGDTWRNRLADALQDHSWAWSTMSSSLSALALDDTAYNGQYLPKLCANLGGGSSWSTHNAVAIAIETQTSNNTAVIKPGSSWHYGANSSGNVITYEGFLTGVSGTNTFDSAFIGVLSSLTYTGAGTLAWHNLVASGTFTAVAITSVDTLTVNWQITIG